MDASEHHPVHEKEAKHLFHKLANRENKRVPVDSIVSILESAGVTSSQTLLDVEAFSKNGGRELSYDEFMDVLDSSVLVLKALSNELVIPNFPHFVRDLRALFEETRSNTAGDVARYIPQLARVNPDQYGAAVCTVDGQRFSIGDAKTLFCVQSTSKPVTYCLALEEHGADVVHRHVGREPSGRNFNERVLNADGLPHNPLINSGAIMTTALVKANLSESQRFEYIVKQWQRLSGGFRPAFDNSTYLSERSTADRNFCLAYMMKETGAFPTGTNLERTLQFYFQLCAVKMNCESMSVVGATLANGGVCPTTGERVLEDETVRACLSLMMSSGMYDFSGYFGFRVGLPAKSGVSGVVMCIIPGVAGFCTWSPRIDESGNSVRGVEFFTKLVDRYAFHCFDSLMVHNAQSQKCDPTRRGKLSLSSLSPVKLLYAAHTGNLRHIKELLARGIGINATDYKGRTALHLAAAGGRLQIVRYLLCHGADTLAEDKTGLSPVQEALRNNHTEIAQLLENWETVPAPQTPRERFLAYVDEDGDSIATLKDLQRQVGICGISRSDPRLKDIFGKIENGGGQIDADLFEEIIRESALMKRLVCGELAIPEFSKLSSICGEIYDAVSELSEGKLSQHIPELESVDPEKFAFSLCSVDGQRSSWGDASDPLCVQALFKPLNYCIAQELLGPETVHERVGCEPSGRNFNELAMNTDGKPHNPMINAGAIMVCSMVQPEEELSDRFDYVLDVWRRASGGSKIGFCNSTYLSERRSADRNYCLAYMMLEEHVFPESTDIDETLELYFQLCALEANCETLSVVAATLANGGVCPLTGDRIFSSATVKNCLSIMLSCGMYSFSGEFQYLYGFPAKSGVTGCIMCIIPNVMGFCVWSPKLDNYGNSVRGLEVIHRLSSSYILHMHDTAPISKPGKAIKADLSQSSTEAIVAIHELLEAAGIGDVVTVRSIHAKGVSLNCCDYDARTPLHVAAAEGQEEMVKYLLRHTSAFEEADRWGLTPLIEAERHGHTEIATLLENAINAQSKKGNVHPAIDTTKPFSTGLLDLSHPPAAASTPSASSTEWLPFPSPRSQSSSSSS